MTPVTLIHHEYRFDNPPAGGAYRGVGTLPDGHMAVLTFGDLPDAADSRTAGTLEFAFGLHDAQFWAQRILAGDMGAARQPGMSRMLAAAVVTLAKAGMASGALDALPAPKPDDGAGA